MAFWNSAEIEFLQNNLNGTTKEIYQGFCSYFGTARTYDSVQKQVRNLRVQFQDSPDDMFETGDTPSLQDLAEQALSAPMYSESNSATSAYLFNMGEGASTQPVQELVFPSLTAAKAKAETTEWIAEIINTVGRSYLRPALTSSERPSMVVLLTDVHFGKKTKIVNLDVITDRMVTLPKRLLESGNVPTNVDEIVVVLGGDIIEGEDIFPTQNGMIEAPVIKQIKVATKAIWQMLKNMKATFPGCKIRVETFPGNHGRTSKSADPRTNWDNVIYQTLCHIAEETHEDVIQVVPNIEWLYEFEVKGKKGLGYHYGVKHTGTPAMQVKLANWIVSKGIDFMVKGHHHKWEVGTHLGRPVISNGSMCGPDEYSEELALDEPARQAFFMVYPDRPLNCFNYIQWDK